jgi:aminobenzoyl-glutamate utilization protein B
MDMGFAQYREHTTPTMRMHRVITDGGDQPNVVPRRAAVWWYFRDSTAEGAARLFEQAKKIAQGAALMSNTTVDVDVMSAVWPVRGNRTLAELVEREIELVGLPRWSKEEDELARALQAKINVQVEGLASKYVPMKGPAVQKAAANDAGDVSWKVPMVKLYFPATVPNINFHHWAAGVPLATSIAHKGAVAGAKVMSASLIECFTNPAKVEETKRTFKEELGGPNTRHCCLVLSISKQFGSGRCWSARCVVDRQLGHSLPPQVRGGRPASGGEGTSDHSNGARRSSRRNAHRAR